MRRLCLLGLLLMAGALSVAGAQTSYTVRSGADVYPGVRLTVKGLTLTEPLAITSGGTGANNRQAALNALLKGGSK